MFGSDIWIQKDLWQGLVNDCSPHRVASHSNATSRRITSHHVAHNKSRRNHTCSTYCTSRFCMIMDLYNQQKTCSYQNLQSARDTAKQKTKYASEIAREQMSKWVQDRFSKPLYDWQLDAAEALLLGLDSIIISPTGSGKSLPFIIPLAIHNPSKKL